MVADFFFFSHLLICLIKGTDDEKKQIQNICRTSKSINKKLNIILDQSQS